jgi:tetratricopeptide (TPR) repeat protein
MHLGQIFYCARRYEDAREAIQGTLEVSPDFSLTPYLLGVVCLQEHKLEESQRELQKALSLSPKDDETRAALGCVYALSGRRGLAQEILTELKQQAKVKSVSPYAVAMLCVGLSNKEQAYEWLEEAYEQRESELPWIAVEPIFDPLRADAHFHDLLRRMNLPS